MYKAAKDSKDQGGFHDFVEILKLYDKNNDDTMLGHELFKLLTNLGEKLTKEEAKNLMKDLCEPEDDDGFMPFKRKLLYCTICKKDINWENEIDIFFLGHIIWKYSCIYYFIRMDFLINFSISNIFDNKYCL